MDTYGLKDGVTGVDTFALTPRRDRSGLSNVRRKVGCDMPPCLDCAMTRPLARARGVEGLAEVRYVKAEHAAGGDTASADAPKNSR